MMYNTFAKRCAVGICLVHKIWQHNKFIRV